MTWKRGLLGALVVVLLLAGGVLAYRLFFAAPVSDSALVVAPTSPAPDVDTVAVAIDAGSVSAEGQIAPLRHAALAFATAGQVTEILAAEGDTVTAGEPILRLDTSDAGLAVRRAEAALAAAEANLAAAQARLRAAQTGGEAAELDVAAAEVNAVLAAAEARPEEVALREASVALAEARVAQATAAQGLVLAGVGDARIRAAEADLRAAEAQAIVPRLELEQLRGQEEPDAEALAQAERDYNAALAAIDAARTAVEELQQGATTAQQRAAGSGVVAAAAQRDAAQAELDLLLAGGQSEQVAIAGARLAGARAALAEAMAAVDGAMAAVSLAEADVRGAQAALTAAQTALADRTLTAPFAGTVADLAVAPGEVIAAGVPAVVVADFSGWLVETTDLTELDVVAVAAGFPARVRADALPDETFAGTVTDIAGVAQEVRGDTTYVVTIRLDNAPEQPLRWGMTVFVTIETDGS